MGIARNLAMVLFAGSLLPNAAFALPRSYAREHPAECAEAWAKKTDWRSTCASRAFCDAHRNDDRMSRIACDPYVSKADRSRASVTISRAFLDSARDLTGQETFFVCQPFLAMGSPPPGTMLPAKMKTARLAVCAAISVWTFPPTIVKVGIGPAGTGMLEVSWSRNGTGARVTDSLRLSPAEVTQILVALNRSDFWRLPHEPGHLGVADGEIATVEATLPGRSNHVMDAIGDGEAVDSSILVNALSEIIASHWKNVPGS